MLQQILGSFSNWRIMPAEVIVSKAWRDDRGMTVPQTLCNVYCYVLLCQKVHMHCCIRADLQSVSVVTALGFLHRSLLPLATCPLLRHWSVIAIVTYFIVKCIPFFLRLCQAGDPVGQLFLFRGEWCPYAAIHKWRAWKLPKILVSNIDAGVISGFRSHCLIFGVDTCVRSGS